MPSLIIPESGLLLGASSSSKSGWDVPMVFGLTLSDSVIEDMIKCVQHNKPIQLSLGESPKINYGSKIQHLSSSDNPFPHELYRNTPSDMAFYEKCSKAPFKGKDVRVQQKHMPQFAAMFGRPQLVPKARGAATATNVAAKVKSGTASTGDAALAALQGAMATEHAKKAENTTKYIKEGLPVPGKRAANKSKFLSQNRLGSDSSRSMPTSPALSGVGSPSLGPTSVPLSQQQAEQAKATRRPIIHYLALAPLAEAAIREKVDGEDKEIRLALEKVADLNQSSGKWELRKNYWKELDVWTFKYASPEDRQKVIDNAVRQYDKMRIGTSEPEWDKLLPREERGTGKCLSKLQAKIATGSAKPTKINVPQTDGSGRDTPGGNEDEGLDDKALRSKGTDGSRDTPQPPAPKSKKPSEREAQAKRLLSKNGPKGASKPATVKKAKAPSREEKVKALSSQYVEDSDEEAGDIVVAPPPPKVAPRPIKRSREEEVDSSDSSNVPLSKKTKKDAYSSRPTGQSNTYKPKSTSPQKSSPLASSPPTNASEFEHGSIGRNSSSSASPYGGPIFKAKRKHEEDEPVRRQPSSSNSSTTSSLHPQKRQKSSSISSSSTSSSKTSYCLPPDLASGQRLTDLARKYKMYYPKYIELHTELSALPVHDADKEENLRDMHDRLSRIKAELMEGLRAAGLSAKRTEGADWRSVANGGSIDYSEYF